MRRFCADTHTWVQLFRPLAARATATARLGFSQRAVDDLGSVQNISRCVDAPPIHVARGKVLVDVAWDGYRITASDELYHTRWENVEGVGSLVAPCRCTVTAFNEKALAAMVRQPAKAALTVHADLWLAELLITAEDFNGLLTPEEYAAVTAEDQDGAFVGLGH